MEILRPTRLLAIEQRLQVGLLPRRQIDGQHHVVEILLRVERRNLFGSARQRQVRLGRMVRDESSTGPMIRMGSAPGRLWQQG